MAVNVTVDTLMVKVYIAMKRKQSVGDKMAAPW